MTTPAIIAKDIKAVQYGKTVLDHISFLLEAGQHLAILGPGGSGKTSLLQALAGLLFIHGEVVYSTKPRIAFIQQAGTIKNRANMADFYYQQRFNSCDAEDAITLLEELQKNETAGDADIQTLLQRFHLQHRQHSPLIQLSNGELKKMQLISHLLHKPELLLIDKPFTGLDKESRNVLHRIINELAAEGLTIIMAADAKEIPSCITHIAELDNGRLINYTEKKNFSFTPAAMDPFDMALLPALRSPVYSGPVIGMKDITIRYGTTTILDRLNWTVNSGECWLVSGHNGAGKSTLLSLVTADNPQAYSQQLSLFGKRRGTGESIWDIKQKIGFVSPELHKYFDTGISVFQAIGSGFFDTMGLYRQLTTEQEEIVFDWIYFFQLEAFANKALSFLSASQQRLVLIARAMVKNPLLLALDEPCQGLDEQQTAAFAQLIDLFHAETNVTILYISHYTEDVPACITNILALNKGKATIHTIKKTQEPVTAA